MLLELEIVQEQGSIELDARGRGSIVKPSEVEKGVKYKKLLGKRGEIVLVPIVEIPAHEAWLFRNPETLASIDRGVQQAKAGQYESLGSFAEYADAPLD